MHLTFKDITDYANSYYFKSDVDIDAAIFYSVPTSFFAIDDRIPRTLRELLTEAEGCLKSNYLTGASACARKIIYELAVTHNGDGTNYDERIKSLKSKLSYVDEVYFDTLLTLQQLTSDKVHEKSYDRWQSGHLRLILSTLAEVLHEVYVVPKLREEKRLSILNLKNEVMGAGAPAKNSPALPKTDVGEKNVPTPPR